MGQSIGNYVSFAPTLSKRSFCHRPCKLLAMYSTLGSRPGSRMAVPGQSGSTVQMVTSRCPPPLISLMACSTATLMYTLSIPFPTPKPYTRLSRSPKPRGRQRQVLLPPTNDHLNTPQSQRANSLNLNFGCSDLDPPAYPNSTFFLETFWASPRSLTSPLQVH